MRRKAFWGQSGRMTRQIEGLVNDVLLDCCIGPLGVGLIERATGKHLRWLPWAELHRLTQRGPLEQLGAAVAERSEPYRKCGVYFTPGKCCDLKAGHFGVHLLSEPRILPVEEK